MAKIAELGGSFRTDEDGQRTFEDAVVAAALKLYPPSHDKVCAALDTLATASSTTAPGVIAAGSCFEQLVKANVNRELILALRIEVVSYLCSTLGQMGFLVQQEGANKAC
eukprot:4364090-Pyramimonas_sp.AAC.1